MSNPKLTEWFDGSKFVPAHVGVYERDYSINQKAFYAYAYAKWDGENWRFLSLTIDKADQEKSISGKQNLNWRGLAEQPK